MNVKQCKECIAIRSYFNEKEKWICNECERETYGTAKLTPIVINPQLNKLDCYGFYAIDYKNKIKNDYRFDSVKFYRIDKHSYDFVNENYVNKHDFICYKISEVKQY